LDQRSLEPDGDGGIIAEPDWARARAARSKKVSAPLQAEPSEAKKGGDEKAEGGEASKSEGDSEGEVESAGDKHLAHAIILGIGTTVVLGMAIFSLAASEDKAISSNTWSMLDMVIAIFIAVLWYQAIDCGIDRLQTRLDAASPHFVHFSHLCHAVLLFLAAVVISFKIREDKKSLAIFCGCGAHFVSFSSMGFGVALQEHLADEHAGYGVLLSVPLLAVALVLLYYFFAFFKKAHGMTEVDEEWDDSIDDVENDYLAMALAVVLTLSVNYLIVGKYNNLEDIEGVHNHTPMERKAMLIYAVLLLPIGAFVASKVAQVGATTKSEGLKKVCGVSVSVISMMVAWAFLQAGQWEVAIFSDGQAKIVKRLEWAIMATVCGLVLTVGLSQMQQDTPGRDAGIIAAEKAVAKVGLVALGLVVGFSWEQLFNEAIEHMAEDNEDYEFRLKIGLALGMGILVLPMYSQYFKPAVIKNTAGGD